jgi:hypothetical protein
MKKGGKVKLISKCGVVVKLNRIERDLMNEAERINRSTK